MYAKNLELGCLLYLAVPRGFEPPPQPQTTAYPKPLDHGTKLQYVKDHFVLATGFEPITLMV